METRRHHPDHGARFAIQPEALPKDSRRPIEDSLEELVAKDRHASGSGALIFRTEGAAHRRPRAQGLEKSRRNLLATDSLADAAAGKIVALPPAYSRQAVQGPDRAAPVAEIERRNRS